MSKIKELKPDVIYSNVVADSIVAFYREFKNQGLSAQKLPICATVTSEIEVAAMGPEYAAGHYASFPYFQSIDTPKKKEFVKSVKQRFGNAAVTHHALESAYWQIYIFKQAIEKAGKLEPMAIREATLGQKFDAPSGKVKIDSDNGHAWLTPRIAQCQPDGQYKVVDAYPGPIKPLPYSAYGETDKNLFCTTEGLDMKKLEKT